MKKDRAIPQKLNDLIKSKGYDGASYYGFWKGRDVYVIDIKAERGAYVGYPLFALVDKDGNAEIADRTDSPDIMGL